jgi:hypothetical protein
MSDVITTPTVDPTIPATDPSIDGITVTGRAEPIEFGLVACDLYRDIHKAIRGELFGVVTESGRLDPSDRVGGGALAAQVQSVVGLLIGHAEHEDRHVQPAIEEHLPHLAEIIESDHAALEDRMATLVEMADGIVHAGRPERRPRLHHLYLELSSFTGDYLRHQDVEERVVMPALETAIGVADVVAIHGAIVGAIPPEEMATSLAMMLPLMNTDERAEMLGGMQADAPPEVFDGVWNLARSVLSSADHIALARRLAIG